ncbi:hypothetical protein [Saccharothrix sp. HUAS TT1]|uniref:hypothetical protein n=1 Tax=unclassified Saccharothrix TaxID=2593673 RepID=UPI00345BDC1E
MNDDDRMSFVGEPFDHGVRLADAPRPGSGRPAGPAAVPADAVQAAVDALVRDVRSAVAEAHAGALEVQHLLQRRTAAALVQGEASW